MLVECREIRLNAQNLFVDLMNFVDFVKFTENLTE